MHISWIYQNFIFFSPLRLCSKWGLFIPGVWSDSSCQFITQFITTCNPNPSSRASLMGCGTRPCAWFHVLLLLSSDSWCFWNKGTVPIQLALDCTDDVCTPACTSLRYHYFPVCWNVEQVDCFESLNCRISLNEAACSWEGNWLL